MQPMERGSLQIGAEEETEKQEKENEEENEKEEDEEEDIKKKEKKQQTLFNLNKNFDCYRLQFTFLSGHRC